MIISTSNKFYWQLQHLSKYVIVLFINHVLHTGSKK